MNQNYNRAYRKQLRNKNKGHAEKKIKNNDLEYYLLIYFCVCVFFKCLYYFQYF